MTEPTTRTRASSDGAWKLRVNLFTRVLLLTVKLGAFAYTGFLIMLSEALNNLVDIVVTSSLLLSQRMGRRAADREHPFGHMRFRYIVSLIVSVAFITVTGLQILREAIARLIAPVPLEHPEIALYVLAFSFVVNLIPLGLMLVGKRRDITVKTALYDNINDEITILASVIGVLAAQRGFPLADPIAAMFVAGLIGVMAGKLIRENTYVLLGLSPSAKFYERVKSVAQSVAGVAGGHDMIAEFIGPDAIHLDLDLELAPNTTVQEADRLVAELEEKLRELNVVHCTIRPCAHTGHERHISD